MTKHEVEVPAPKAKPSLRKAYDFDANAMKHGEWIDLAGGQVLVARDGNPRHMQALISASEPYRNKNADLTDPKVQNAITVRATAEAILLDWRGFDEPYSKSAAIALLEDQPDFLTDIVNLSRNRNNFRRKEVENAVPN